MRLYSLSARLRKLCEIARTLLVLAILPLRFTFKFIRFLGAHRALVAENLALRRQLGQFLERGKRPRRASNATRLVIVLLSRLFDWKDTLVIVKPETLIRWHRQGFKLLWRWKSRGGRPPTRHPSAEWTLQQFRETFPWEHDYRWLIHDHDSIFSKALDESVEEMDLKVRGRRGGRRARTLSAKG